MQPHGAPTCPPKVAFEMSAYWPRSMPPSGAMPPPVTRQPRNVVDVDDDVLVEAVDDVLVDELVDDELEDVVLREELVDELLLDEELLEEELDEVEEVLVELLLVDELEVLVD